MKKLVFLGFTLFYWTTKTIAQGCSQCKLVAEQGSELDENSFGSGINSGILYLMIIPYLLIMFLLRKKIAAFFKSRFSK